MAGLAVSDTAGPDSSESKRGNAQRRAPSDPGSEEIQSTSDVKTDEKHRDSSSACEDIKTLVAEPTKNEERSEEEKEAAGEEDEEEEEEGECGFCLFMKGGPCKEQFIAWEECVEEAEKSQEDVVEKCYKVTSLLKDCMDHNSDYYEPILRAERAMNEQVEAEMEQQNSEDKEETHRNNANNTEAKDLRKTYELP